MTPTARSLAHLRRHGATAAVVERYNPHARRRVDLFGFIDIVALDDQSGTLGIQACITSDQSTRLAKIRQEPRARTWLARGNRIVVWGWAKRGPRGKRKLWVLSETVVTAELLDAAEPDGHHATAVNE